MFYDMCSVCMFWCYSGSWELSFVTLCESFQPWTKDTAVDVQEKIRIIPAKQLVCATA